MKNIFLFILLISLCSQGNCGFWSNIRSKFLSVVSPKSTKPEVTSRSTSASTSIETETEVTCHGFNALIKYMPFVNMETASSMKLETKIFFASRNHMERVQIPIGDDFTLQNCDYDPRKKTVLIVHGFMSKGDTNWIRRMSAAYLQREDVNVFIVDWSEGSTWIYWRAVANARGVGKDIETFLKKLISVTGAKPKENFHFIGHSLGAHICSYASNKIGGVYRITGLDPAKPCYATSKKYEQLDASDATFVDVIHSNILDKIEIAFGIKKPIGHVDFYLNGGDNQPGCRRTGNIFKNVINSFSGAYEAVCSHGRSYIVFEESLKNSDCDFVGYQWNYGEKVNETLAEKCEQGLCSIMGIDADKNGIHQRGSFYVPTTGDATKLCSRNPAKLLTKK